MVKKDLLANTSACAVEPMAGSNACAVVTPVVPGAAKYPDAAGTTGDTTAQALDPAMGSTAQADVLANRSFLTKAKDLGITGLQGVEKFMQAPQDAKGFLGTTKAITKAAGPGVSTRMTQDAINTAQQALDDYNFELAEYERITGEAQTADDDARRTAIRAAMIAGNHSEDVISETFALLGLKDGGIASFKDGGIMDLGGKEMDMRTGGFIPIGAKERADDVPARLSKNEFVMTADAVRAAGGGDINKGAKRMYETMNKLEARA